MASMDKIRWNEKQHLDFEWWIENHCFRIMLFTRIFFWELSNPILNIYERPEDIHPLRKTTITNFPTTIDIYLMLFCKLPFVRKRLKEQYGDSSALSVWFNKIKRSIKYKIQDIRYRISDTIVDFNFFRFPWKHTLKNK